MRVSAILSLWHADPRRSEDALRAEIRDEIEHHLACAAAELEAAGASRAAARNESLRRFGDAAAIENQCYRIRTGDSLMLHRLHLLTTAVLLLGVLVLAYFDHGARVEARRVQDELMNRTEQALLLAERLRENRLEDRIRAGDRVRVYADTREDPWIERTVSADGKLLLPGPGWIDVSGLTRASAEEAVRAALEPSFAEGRFYLEVEPRRAGASPLEAVQFEAF